MTGPSARYSVVTFDLWNTLLEGSTGRHGRDRRVDLVGELLGDVGQYRPPDLIHSAFDHAFEVFEHCWYQGELFDVEIGTRAVLSFLKAELPERLIAHLSGQIEWAGGDTVPSVAVGIGEVLEALRSADLRLGIISDTGLTGGLVLRTQLDRLDLLSFFDHWSFSDEVGAFKPAARIFDHARMGLGSPDPVRMLHVGDLLRTDVAGARAVGWHTARYTGFNDDDSDLDEADIVVDSHSEVVQYVLG